MNEHAISKGLEIWVLQNLVNGSVLLGLLVSGLLLAQGYFREIEKHLSLRVSIELLRLGAVLLADALLLAVSLIGYVVLNPDVLADVKVAVPFYPVATVLFASALVLRLFRGGHDLDSVNFGRSLKLTLAANTLNIAGFTFVAEAASSEYLARHPSSFWTYLKTHFRSNADPAGLDLAQLTFTLCFPALVLVGLWGVGSAVQRLKALREGAAP